MAEDFDAEVGAQVGGSNGRRMSDARASLKVDATALQNLRKELDKVKEVTKGLKNEMKLLADEAERASKAMGGISAGKGGGPSNVNKDMDQDLAKKNGPQKPDTQAGAGGGAGGGGGRLTKMAKGFVAAGGVEMAAGMISSGMKSLDSRIDRGIQYATSMDRLNLLTQQMTGMTQMQVINQRKPIGNYKVDINSMMAFQAGTGVQANAGFARSVEGLRAVTGFSKTTQDILTEQRQLMDPDVANRMMFMLGTNAYNIGGGMKDPMQFRQEAIRNLGLTNPSIAESALTPGSITRARMAQMGFGEEMQTSLIQQAQMQVQFEKKGGQGSYDPTNPDHLKRMGIKEGSQLAIQQEETMRVSQMREENFAKRQIDNMAALERSNQALIKAMGSLEETMSGAIGARISNRPTQRLFGGAAKGFGSGLFTAGAVAGATPVGWGLMAAGGAMMLGGALFGGDPVDAGDSAPTNTSLPKGQSSGNDSNIKVPYGYGGNRISLEELKSKPNFSSMHPTMKDRLLKMMRVNPNVGIGQGLRSSSDQERMFRERYQVVEGEDYDVEWNGQKWKRFSGAPAAPPGRSMHEIGLAADLVGDLNWANANASKFGLKHFANVNNEPWHFQPAELPNSRKKYEDQGAPWGTDGGFNEVQGGSNGSASSEVLGDNGREPGGSSAPLNTAISGVGFDPNEVINQNLKAGKTRLGAVGAGYGSNKGGSRDGRTGSAPIKKLPASRGAKEAARAAYAAKFRDEALFKIVAIAGRESGWRSDAVNKSTSDRGMWQINWSANQSIAKRHGAKSIDDLLDLDINAAVAYDLWKGGGFKPWKASSSSSYLGGKPGWDPNGDELWNTDKHQGEALSAVSTFPGTYPASTTGDGAFDAMPSKGAGSSGGGSSSSKTMNFTSSPTIHVAPVINFNGSPSTPDLRGIAQTVSKMLKEEISMLDLRTA